MNVTPSKILENLNPQQREAVETLHGPLLILAGAGSGKTRVVTRRIANLLASGVRPWEILAITFTNKAAQEMRRRVEDLLLDCPGVFARDVWVSTFHSFCARLLRREAPALGYASDFTIFDEEDASSALKDILKRIGANDDKRFSSRVVRQEISSFKSQALLPEDCPDGQYHERLLKQIFREYEAELKKNQAMDFDDLLRMAVVLFKQHPEILERYQQRFKFVLVDEYQDTNSCQYQLVKMLGSGHRNVCATGDPDQSIYAWRGADVRNILSFERDFPEAKVVKLEQNYRSTKCILAAADAVIRNNQKRKEKSLWTENAEGPRISMVIAPDDQMEAMEIVRRIEEHAREGRGYRDMALFYRTNSQSRSLEEALRHRAVAYQLIGGTAFYERREIKDALAYLRLVLNPKDDVAFRRVINVPRRALGDSTVEVIEQEAVRRGVSMLEALDGMEGQTFINTFKPKPRQGLIQFARLIDGLRVMPQFPVLPIMEKMLEESGLRQSLIEADELERVDNLDELMNAAAEFDKERDPAKAEVAEGEEPFEPGALDGMEEWTQHTASLAGFLENSALVAPTDEFDPTREFVTLMTLHMAKGLEFPIVFITGMEEGLIPLVRSSGGLDPEAAFNRGMNIEDPAAIEEERRLMYVGITRAMEKLYITRALMRRRFGKLDRSMPSRFLREVPDKLLERASSVEVSPWTFGNTGGSRRSEFAEPVLKNSKADDDFANFEREVSSVFSDEAPPPVINRRPARHEDEALRAVVDKLLDVSDVQEEPRVLEIGDRVRHGSFGVGTVESITGSGLSMKVKVQFSNAGSKVLLMSLAKLEKI